MCVCVCVCVCGGGGGGGGGIEHHCCASYGLIKGRVGVEASPSKSKLEAYKVNQRSVAFIFACIPLLYCC